MQFCFMPERRTVDALFILRRLQEGCHAKRKKLYMYFVDLEKAFDRLLRKVLEYSMRKKEVLDRPVMSLYGGENTRFRVDSDLSEEFEVNVGVHQGSVLLPFLFAEVIDVT